MIEQARDGWPKIITMVACIGVLIIDTSAIPTYSSMWFRTFYIVAAVGLLTWRWTHHRFWLVVFGSLFTSATVVRACLLGYDGGRWSGVAVNVLLAIFAYGYVRNRHDNGGTP